MAAKKEVGAERVFNPAEVPAWVSEGSLHKYHRAVRDLRTAGTPVTEEAVREMYLKFGGRDLDIHPFSPVELDRKGIKA